MPGYSPAGARVVIERVSKGYLEGDRHHRVLKDASAALEAGEHVALLGPSGSGKSTLLNLLGAIDSPDSGRILVDGTDVTSLIEPERTLFRRSRVGLVFQFFNLLPTLTVEENLLLPLELTRGRLDRDARDRANALLERVGLAARSSALPDRLSGGEQQRVAVARALVHEPALVLADEPTGSLDERSGQMVVSLLEELVLEGGGTLLLVTHSETLAARADRVLRITDGALVADPGGGDPPRPGDDGVSRTPGA